MSGKVAPTATPTPTPPRLRLRPPPRSAGVETPFSGTAISVPGTIQAEDFDNGGQGIAYNSPLTSNPGGVFRSTGVGIEASADSGGGYDVGWATAGEWIKYTINVASSGNYNLAARVATVGNGGAFHIAVDGNSAGSVSVPNTGGWQSWTTISAGTVYLTAGQHVLSSRWMPTA